jgi:hypothetical protein
VRKVMMRGMVPEGNGRWSPVPLAHLFLSGQKRDLRLWI